MKYEYDQAFVWEIQKRYNWPVFYGVGPFECELEARVAITYYGGGISTGRMMVPKPEYESLPESVHSRLGEPIRSLESRRGSPYPCATCGHPLPHKVCPPLTPASD